jgi:transcriptional regulator with XRE-family HTH domain
MTRKQLGRTLERIRKSKGLSQYTLAKETGLSREYIRQLEKGQSEPTVGTLRRLAEALKVTLVTLAEGYEVLETLVSGVVAGVRKGDRTLAMKVLVMELKDRPGLILGSWEELRSSGAQPRHRSPQVVKIALEFLKGMPPLKYLPPNDRLHDTIQSLARGLTDLVERA